ncbi:MAG: ABC transporter ATP-binding protein [Vicinamibacterales bacterium]|jgi:ABC-2 type transport system ATP-binding protein
MSTPAIAVNGVSKRFGEHQAVNNVSIAVPAGSIYGFIGPNGSGKTTTIRMIMNIIVPDSGQIEVLGKNSAADVRDDVGYLPEERGLYKKMTVKRVLQYYGQLKGKPASEIESGIRDWLGRLELSDWADKKVEQLSKGMAQKVQFIAAVVSKPKLLILDEPFSGLDPVNAEALKDAVLEMRRRGTTIVFSTHDMHAAELMCERIFMIFRGNKVLDGTLDDIQNEYGYDTARVRTSGGAAVLAGMPSVDTVNDHGNYQDVKLNGDPQAFLQALVQKTTVQRFEIRRPSLHDIFVRIARPTAEELRDDERALIGA